MAIYWGERPGSAGTRSPCGVAEPIGRGRSPGDEDCGRNESVALWIVPRDVIMEVQEPYVADVFDRDYRRVDGYSIKVKLKEARDRTGVARSGG